MKGQSISDTLRITKFQDLSSNQFVLFNDSAVDTGLKLHQIAFKFVQLWRRLTDGLQSALSFARESSGNLESL